MAATYRTPSAQVLGGCSRLSAELLQRRSAARDDAAAMASRSSAMIFFLLLPNGMETANIFLTIVLLQF